MLLDYKELFGGEKIEKKSAEPVLNENYFGIGSTTHSTKPYNYNKIMAYVKKSPEALGWTSSLIKLAIKSAEGK